MFGARLRQLREERGLRSQQALAQELGVSQSTIANWEAGRREPGFPLLKKLADYFQVSLDYLLGRSDDPQGGAVSDGQLRAALFGGPSGLDPAAEDELWEETREYALYRLQHYRRRA